MDHSLHCNSLRCRVQLTERAAVTTCSHIFCLPCSESSRLNAQNGQRMCPACQTPLEKPDDAVLTNLNPTEDYKTSVLSGLDPTTIMECAGRALEFWNYQMLQERVYQEHLAKSLAEERKTLNTELDRLVNNFNAEFGVVQDKLSTLQIEHESLQRKNHELTDAYREKSRKCTKTQELYDRLKKRTLLSQMPNAMSAAAGPDLPHSPLSDPVVDALGNPVGHRTSNDHSPLVGQGIFVQPNAVPQQAGTAPNHTMRQNRVRQENKREGNGEQVAGYVETPSNHRQRLPLSTIHPQQALPRQQDQGPTFSSGQQYQAIGNQMPNLNKPTTQSFLLRQGQGSPSYPAAMAPNTSSSRSRRPLDPLSSNFSAGYGGGGDGGGHGLSAGVKVGRHGPNGVESGQYIGRPRVARRQGQPRGTII